MAGIGCSKKPQNTQIDKQLAPDNTDEKEELRAPKIRLVKKVQHDLLGQGTIQNISLYVYEHTSASPASWSVTVDHQEILDLDRDNYDVADIEFMNIDRDVRDEILVYRTSGGSSGARALNIYKPGSGKWKELFAAKNSFDLSSNRFQMKYTGNYKVSFEDTETGLKALIPLEKERYKGTENSLSEITSWVDPISDYEFGDKNGDGVKEITTIQRVFGISHADTIALLKTEYIMRDQEYHADTVSIHDDKVRLLAQVKLPVNEIKILTDVKKYSPLMSAVQGIGMTPEFRTSLNGTKVRYHWSTGSGNFLLVQNKKVKEVINLGEKLLWIPEFQDNKGINDIVIKVQAEEVLTGRILAETSLVIEQDGVFYTVKP